MKKKRKIDFVLNDNSLFGKTIFRFYPRQSSCHSFGDEPPKDYSDVYKVYFAYSIFEVDKEDGEHHMLFECSYDECSVIDEIAARIELICDGHETYTNEKGYTFNLLNEDVYPIGYGVTWNIQKHKFIPDAYKIMMWDWDNIGYRFCLNKDKLKAFGEYLQECCDYMLAHGDPI